MSSSRNGIHRIPRYLPTYLHILGNAFLLLFVPPPQLISLLLAAELKIALPITTPLLLPLPRKKIKTTNITKLECLFAHMNVYL